MMGFTLFDIREPEKRVFEAHRQLNCIFAQKRTLAAGSQAGQDGTGENRENGAISLCCLRFLLFINDPPNHI